VSLLDLTAVKPHLKIDQSTDDTVLQAKLDAAEAYVSRQSGGVGALAVAAVTERVEGYRPTLSLRRRPVVSVMSVTDAGGNVLTVADLDVDLERGRIGYSPIAPVVFPMPWYEVVYQSGYASAADLGDLAEAVRLMTQHFYATQRGPAARPATGGSPGSVPDAYARAQQILDEYRSPGIA
jgi:uncharacterized phiE125 gp8 family phage protein